MNKVSDNRRALGRGLSTLLPTRSAGAAAAALAAPNPGLLRLPIDQIDANRSQPRTEFRPEQLHELAASIKVHGVIQPIIVRRNGTRYELVAGERRWRACRLAGMVDVPVLIQDIADEHLLEIALIENLQREDLNAMETAQAFDRLHRQHGLSHEQLAERTGKDRSTIANIIRLLKLPSDLQQMVMERRLSMGHARAILALPTEALQRSAAEKTVAQGLSVRNVERLVQRMLEPREPDADPEKQDPNVSAAIAELERILGTRVRIIAKGDKRGRIEIDYFSQDDLDRIYSQIVRED